MKKLIAILIVMSLLLAALVLGGINEAYSGGRNVAYGFDVWLPTTGGIKYTEGTIVLTPSASAYAIDMNTAGVSTAEIRGSNGETIDNVTDGAWDVSGATLVHDTDVVYSLKTVIKTIDITATATTDDFNFDATAANSTAQNLDLGGLIPAWSEITSCVVRCFESVGAGTFQITLGTSSAGNQLLAQATVDAEDEFTATAATASPVVATTAAGQGVWLQGDPSGNWDAAGGTGRWAVMVTYIDYDAVYTVEGP